jgi:Domain of Unknown Function (DUF1080)
MKQLLMLLLLVSPLLTDAQQKIPLEDMSFWKPSDKTNWQIAGDVVADVEKHEMMTRTAGKGILSNIPDDKNRANLQSVAEYGDVDVSFDFMMANHSNSGFYLMGRYEVQLLDSWGVKNPNTGDCGGIYKRRRYENGKEILWEGHAPRLNACLAPGLWQHLDISFQAPRFDEKGKKTANAKILFIKMNGVTVQENVELTGPTGGAIVDNEAATGPFMIQGDHGPVAFRNFVISNLTGKPAEMTNISYKVFYGKFKEPADFLSKKPDASGSLEKLSWDVSKQENDFAQIFNATLKIPQAGNHKFTFQIGGKYYVKVVGKELLPDDWTFTNDQRSANIELPTGDVPVEITIYKTDDWMSPILGMFVQGPNFRAAPYHSLGSMLAAPPTDPIFLNAPEPTILRSFSDIYKNGKKQKRITHAVNVGNPDKLHYTYDLDNGAIAQIWKGDFLDTSPMWDNRGDGSSRPRGAVLTLEDVPLFVRNDSKGSILDLPAYNSEYRALGYDLNTDNLPTFRYQIYGSEVEDQIRITDGKYLTRSLNVKNLDASKEVKCRLAIGKSINKLTEDLYEVDGKSYYIKLMDGIIPTIEKVGDVSLLLVPVKDKVQYAILW